MSADPALSSDGEESSVPDFLALSPDDFSGCSLSAASLQVIPLYGSTSSFFLPLCGVALGTAMKSVVDGATGPASKPNGALGRGGLAVGGVVAACLAACTRLTPETGRPRIEARWPWTDPATEAIDPRLEAILEQRLLSKSHKQSLWVSDVFSKLKKNNMDVTEISQSWKLKVIDPSVPMYLCFVVPHNRSIWLSDYYLGLVEHDSQLGYAMGHELGHVICGHTRDLCFIQFVRQGGLFGAGIGAGWLVGSSLLASSSLAYLAFAVAFSTASALVFNIFWTLPYMRLIEREADVVGLKLAAKACFNVNQIPDHWRILTFRNTPPEWRSTHPSPPSRASRLQSLLPWAHKIQKQNCP